MRRGRYDAAADTIDRMEKAAGKEADPEQAAEQRAYVARLRSSLALKQGRWAEAVAWHTSAVAFDPTEAEAVSYVYSELVRAGRPAEAMPLIAGDKKRPIRAHLWRGLALRAQGKRDEARRAWETATGAPFEEAPRDQRMDWILSSYYLGDARRRAQAAALQWVNEREQAPVLGLFLAGLGAALHGDMHAAILDLDEAAQEWQVMGETRRIPHSMWYFAEQLLDEEQQAELRPYFEDEPA
jgi:tetratricopeptide (TPR) repeat protein